MASKGNEKKETIKKEDQGTMLQQTHYVRQRGMDEIERVSTFRRKRRDEVLEGDIFKIGGGVKSRAFNKFQ